VEVSGVLAYAGRWTEILPAAAGLFLLFLVNAAAMALPLMANQGREGPASFNAGSKTGSLLSHPGRWHLTLWFSRVLFYLFILVPAVSLYVATPGGSSPTPGKTLLFLLVLGFVLLLSGELLPRLWAARHPGTIFRNLAWMLVALDRLFRPFTQPILWLLKKSGDNNPALSRSEEAGEMAQSLESPSDALEDEKEILRGIAKFGNKNVEEIMTPRVDVVALDVNTAYPAVLETITHSGYSRIPVYSESFDQVRGILYIKDLLPHTDKGATFRWQELLRPPFFIPETRKVKDLLEDFQKNKIHMGIVVDEYGGSPGIVTLEDVLEEIVGDIADEFDEDEVWFNRLGENQYLFDGKTPLGKFAATLGYPGDYFDDARGEADTLAGLLLEIRGEIPLSNEIIIFRNLRFIIEAVTNRRIQQVRVELPEG